MSENALYFHDIVCICSQLLNIVYVGCSSLISDDFSSNKQFMLHFLQFFLVFRVAVHLSMVLLVSLIKSSVEPFLKSFKI